MMVQLMTLNQTKTKDKLEDFYWFERDILERIVLKAEPQKPYPYGHHWLYIYIYMFD